MIAYTIPTWYGYIVLNWTNLKEKYIELKFIVIIIIIIIIIINISKFMLMAIQSRA